MDCNRAMAKLEKARAELRCFEQEDRPSFARWMAATFGALLTELREKARLVHERQALVDEVELEMMFSTHRNPRKAYAAVMKRRATPDEEDAFADAYGSFEETAQAGPGDDGNGREGFDPREGMDGGIPERERRVLFDDFARSVLGVNPKRMDKAEYEQLYAEFEAEMFGGPSQPGSIRARDREKPPATREESRIKEIYRVLVRRLHPDLRADGDATVSAIWHEVQEAYERQNLDRLETLLALTEMESGTNGGQASLSQMRLAAAEIERAFRAIRRSLGEAKRDPAWGFSRNPYHGPMETRIRREMEESLDQLRWTLSGLDRTIEAWSRSWHSPSKTPRSPANPPGGPKANRRETDRPAAVQPELFPF